MTEQDMADIFSDYGYSSVYHRFKTPLYVTGLLDDMEPALLEDFFEHMELSPDLFFDEFRFWIQYYAASQNNHS